MLRNLKKHWRSWFAVFLGISVILLIVWFSDSFQQCINKSYKESSDYESKKGIAQIISTLGWAKTCAGQFLIDDGEAITAFFTLVVGLFTGALWLSTNKLWRSAEMQIETNRQIAADQMQQTRVSNAQAIRAANAAVKSTEHLNRIERAYLFLAMEVTSGIFIFDPTLPDTVSHIEFGFKNHGKTPATIDELHVMAKFWRDGWPAIAAADKMTVQKGWAVSAGETQDGYSIKFRLRSDEIERARAQKGYILFWGKVVYSDVFGDTHESGWCRAYNFPAEGWQFAGDQTLDYQN